MVADGDGQELGRVLLLGVRLDLSIVVKTLGLLAVGNQASHVAAHLLNLANQTNEIVLNSAQEVRQRRLDLFHLLLDADDTLLELLADVGGARIILALGNQDLLSLDVALTLGLKLNVVVSRPLVDHLDVRELVAHDFVLDRALVAVARLVLDVAVDQRVLREHFAHEELLGQGKSLDNI